MMSRRERIKQVVICGLAELLLWSVYTYSDRNLLPRTLKEWGWSGRTAGRWADNGDEHSQLPKKLSNSKRESHERRNQTDCSHW